MPIPRPPPTEEPPLHIDIPIEPAPQPQPSEPPPTPAAAAIDDEPESLLPAAGTLQPESVLNDSAIGDSRQLPESVLEDFDALEAAASEDAALEEARGILLRAVRSEAPLAGSLTILRLRRARSRSELAGLIDEVEARIIKPYRSLAAQQTLRRARELLFSQA